jgi:hypothetical protein
MKDYYLIYHEDARESTYASGLRVPYKNGSINVLNSSSISILDLIDTEWLEKHDLTAF